ncbi:MAG: FMN-binding negative transcriptional regulator [Thermoplasmatales archaeon]|nr:FMN-binding negative transcriptional regulator [Thermoplasmatales archaeon]
MYIPKWFKVERIDLLQEAINKISFGTIITTGTSGIMASHVPMLIDPSKGSSGVLFGHIARGNSQWRETLPGSDGLATFVGPNAYITPNWYSTKKKTGKVVPTWNYINVQVRGSIVFVEDHKRLLEIVTKLTDHHESSSKIPWKVTDAPSEYIDGELESIIGFEMKVSKIEGKWKLSQNRSPEDREGVKVGLADRGEPLDKSVLKEMEDQGPRE